MSRYIDADIELKRLKAMKVEGETFTTAVQFAITVLENAPSIDLVRCKECKKANTEDCSHSYWDDDWGEWRVGYKGDDWFCADGEKGERVNEKSL